MAKQKLQTFLVTVRMDKPCCTGVALKGVRDCIHGEFYPTAEADGDPERFKIVSFKRVPKGALL